MIPAADFTESSPANDQIDMLSHIASRLSLELVDIAGTLDQIDNSTIQQLKSLKHVSANADRMVQGNTSVNKAIDLINKTTTETLEAVIFSVENIQSAGNRTQKLAKWVRSLDNRITEIEDTIASARSNNDDIASIAAQVNILAINAKIEAARAGEAGRGFAVVAEAINELSRKTAGAAEGISDSILTLGNWIDSLRGEASVAAGDADGVLNEADETDISLSNIAEHVRMINSEAKQIKENTGHAEYAISEFGESFERMGTALEGTASGIHQVRERADTMVEQAERLVQCSVSLGGATLDSRFIDEVQARASLITMAFEEAVANGAINRDALFEPSYKPVPGSNPQQFLTEFTNLTDSILPPIQEPALEFDPSVVFCAAIDRNGYIPTHNMKFSHPMGDDPVWNMANCRNRRIFDDKVGLKAGNNMQPFLLQVYRRDMGGGEFVTMKDVSAPILVGGQLWGGLRLAYTT